MRLRQLGLKGKAWYSKGKEIMLQACKDNLLERNNNIKFVCNKKARLHWGHLKRKPAKSVSLALRTKQNNTF